MCKYQTGKPRRDPKVKRQVFVSRLLEVFPADNRYENIVFSDAYKVDNTNYTIYHIIKYEEEKFKYCQAYRYDNDTNLVFVLIVSIIEADIEPYNILNQI